MPIDGQWRNPAITRCDRKIAYGNWKRAEARAKKKSDETGELIIAYQCYDCGKFHIGHADESQHIVRQVRDTSLPWNCPRCDNPIAPERRSAAEATGSATVYCSVKCQVKHSRQKRHARRAARETGA